MTFSEDMQAVSADLVETLGETAVFTGFTGPVSIKVVLDTGVESIDPYTGDVQNDQPVAIARSTDVAGAKHKDTLRIGNVVYEVVEARPDGLGITELLLNKLRTD